jgi:hypothetical protein
MINMTGRYAAHATVLVKEGAQLQCMACAVQQAVVSHRLLCVLLGACFEVGYVTYFHDCVYDYR